MKLELRVGDKKLIEPEFDCYQKSSEKNVLMIGGRNIENEVWMDMSKELIIYNFETHMENAILGLELKNKIYSFDLSEYLDCFFSSISTDYFYIVFCFVESDGKIREEVVKKIKMEIA